MKVLERHFNADAWRRSRIPVSCALSFLALLSGSPSPARAQANEPPLIIIDRAYGTGSVVWSPKGPLDSVTVELTDSLTLQNFATPPKNTVPADAFVEFHWHSELRSPGVYPVAYQYKLDEASFVSVDTSVHSVRYDALGHGRKVFLLRVIDNLGGSRETNRRFAVNFPPETWIAGPDTALLNARFGWTSHDQRHFDIANWNGLPDLSGTLLSCDSITVWPAQRAEHQTFFEIYGDRLYVRSEGDTVHLNSWVITRFGGSDLDSPYAVEVDPSDPALEDTVICGPNGEAKVLRPAGKVGSAVAFRHKGPIVLDPNGPLTIISFSNPYPVYDPNSNFREPHIAGYDRASYSGRVFLHGRAVDGHHDEDESVGSAYQIVRCADLGLDCWPPAPGEVPGDKERRLRHKVMTFYVNQDPVLLYEAPGFVPVPHHVFSSRHLELNLLADDPDPYDRANPAVGGPTGADVLRWNVRIEGRNANGGPVVDSPLSSPVFTPRIDVTVPDEIAGPDATLYVQLCDCASCESQPGSGRCVEDTIPVRIPTDLTPVLASLISARALPDRVVLSWSTHEDVAVRVERRAPDGEWRPMGERRSDASGVVVFEDVDVVPSARYGYRLVLTQVGEEIAAGETWVDVPARFEFALEGARPNPARNGEMTIHLSLANAAPARLELLDVGGRRWVDRALGSPGAGRHSIALRHARIPPGVYLVRLTQGASVRVARVAVIE
jgi:hypothetical protein